MSHISDSSSPGIKPAAHESTETDNTQIITSDGNNSTILISSDAHDVVSPSTEIQTPPHDSTQTDINQIISSEAGIKHENASSSEIQPVTSEPTPIPVSEANNSSYRQTQPTIHESAQTPSTDQPATANIHEKPKDATSEDRKQELKNLIDQELKFISDIAPELGKHQVHLTTEANKIQNKVDKMKKGVCDLPELKDVKKEVTKLKLQIPARYRTSADSSQQKNQQHGGSAESKRLQHKLPQFCYNSVFEQSPMCKLIQERYKELDPELKLCLLSFSVFPENADISRRAMVYWWIADGFLPSMRGGKTEEELANKYFNDLLEKDFIEPVNRLPLYNTFQKKKGPPGNTPQEKEKPPCNVATCKMHPLIRSAVVTLATKMKFFDFDKDGKTKDFGIYDEIGGPEDVSHADAKEFFDFFGPDKKLVETVDFEDENGNATQFVDMDQIGTSPSIVEDNKGQGATNSEDNKGPGATNSKDNKGQGATNSNSKVQKEETVPLIDHNGKKVENKHYFYQKKKIFTNSYQVCLVGNGLPKGLEWENIHILFNVEDTVLAIKPEWFMRLKNVNVVFLGRWKSSGTHHIEVEDLTFLENLQNMKHVRFFSLQGVSGIAELPESISHLKNLKILDLRACHNLEKIPKGIDSLALLTHLDISDCYLLDHMPKEISSLLELQVLKGFVVGDSPGKHSCTLDDLAKLRNLRKFSMYTRMKEFPEDSHLKALRNFKVLSKLTIAWGGHASKEEPKVPPNNDAVTMNDKKPSWQAKLLSWRQGVKGRLERQNAIRPPTVALNDKLEKLDLKCYPKSDSPSWLMPSNLQNLKKLYIRGGQFSDLGQFQDFPAVQEGAVEPEVESKSKWSNVEVLRLKYLDQLEMDWKELLDLFPKLKYIEKVKCPKLTLFPCDESGVWMKEDASS